MVLHTYQTLNRKVGKNYQMDLKIVGRAKFNLIFSQNLKKKIIPFQFWIDSLSKFQDIQHFFQIWRVWRKSQLAKNLDNLSNLKEFRSFFKCELTLSQNSPIFLKRAKSLKI